MSKKRKPIRVDIRSNLPAYEVHGNTKGDHIDTSTIDEAYQDIKTT